MITLLFQIASQDMNLSSHTFILKSYCFFLIQIVK